MNGQILDITSMDTKHPGLAEINAHVGSQEFVSHIFDPQLLIGKGTQNQRCGQKPPVT